MAYISTSDVKAWGGWLASDAGDDSVIALAIPYAQQMIDSYCKRTFEYTSDDESVRYFDAKDDIRDVYSLVLDMDLHNIVSISVDGTAISSNSYVTEPRSDAPYWGITILSSSSDSWDYGTDSENAIAINGNWAYSSSAPADIKIACINLVNWLIKQRNSDLALAAPIIDASAGVTILPITVPNVVRLILQLFRKPTFEVI